MNKKKIIALAVAVIVIAGTVTGLLSGRAKKREVTYEMAVVGRQDISNFVTATGTIEPVTEVEVGTQVSGIIDKIYVDYNTVVKEGQLIAEMDKVTLQSDLASARATYDGAIAEYEYQESLYKRNKELHDKKLISDIEYEQSLYDYRRTKSAYDSSKAALEKAERNLSYATITAPIDGVVISKDVEEGQTVASGFETPTLFTIAADLTQMQVVADVDEADIGGVQEGQRVEFSVDAYPGDTFEGYVTQIRLGESSDTSSSTSTSSTVVTYEVVISAPNPDLKLKPRLTANITIYTLDKRGVLSVPTKALRFNPVTPIVGKDAVINDCEGEYKVWTRDNNQFTAHAVVTGISNGTYTEIVDGIAEGTSIVADADFGNVTQEVSAGSSERSPFMPGPPDRNDKKDEKKE